MPIRDYKCPGCGIVKEQIEIAPTPAPTCSICSALASSGDDLTVVTMLPVLSKPSICRVAQIKGDLSGND